VNAISSNFDVQSHGAGERWRLSFADGAASSGWARAPGSSTATGVSVTFKLDPAFLPNPVVDPAVVERRLEEFAARRPGAELGFGLSDGLERKISFPNGWSDFIRRVSGHCAPLHEPLVLTRAAPDLELVAALQWTEEEGGGIFSWANGIRSHSGSHLRALERGLGRAISATARALGADFPVWRPTLALPGLWATFDLEMKAPRWAGSIKGDLEMPEVEEVLEPWIEAELERELAASPKIAGRLVERLRRGERSFL
jgi:DNA gyrase/topoisomerase IV subunit B